MSILRFDTLCIACRNGLGTLAVGLALHVSPALAQTDDDAEEGPRTISQAVVQPIPSRDSHNLNDALVRLGRDPRDVGALIEAGNSALMLGDIDAATGFFRRADQISPGNPRVKAGLAGAMVRNGNPFDAIPLFQDAERAGAIDSVLAGDRGLAYDLVGDNEAAQRYYRLALARSPNDEVTRRLALSMAIAGDRRGAETILSPQLQSQDKSAWRTRAFALAILGQPEEAVAITRTILPEELATAIAPYLRYMPRLTPAQQAAAANFGAFPRASEIGRDDPRVALFAPPGKRPVLATADAGLVPRGEPLGTRSRSERSRRQDRRDDTRVAVTQPPRIAPGEVQPAIETGDRPVQVAIAPARPQPSPAPVQTPPVAAQPLYRPPAVAAVHPVSAPAPPPAQTLYVPPPPTNASPVVAPPVQVPAAQVTLAPAPPVTVAATPVQIIPVAAQAPVAVSVTAPAPSPPAATISENSAAGFDLARLPASTASAQPAASTVQAAPAAPPVSPSSAMDSTSMSGPVVASAIPLPTALAKDPFAAQASNPAPPPSAVTPASLAAMPLPAPATTVAPPPAAGPDRVSLSAAFADISRPVSDTAPSAGAVDVRRIQPARPKPPPTETETRDRKGDKAEKKPAPPSHPSRIWVQVATGRDKTALAYDWRRMTREASDAFKGRNPHVSAWGQTNRLLAGPFASETAANSFMAQLRRADISGSFVWTSPAGQVVDSLGSR